MRELKLAGAACLALAMAMGAGAGTAHATTYRFASSWSFEASQLGQIVAQEKGLFARDGADIKIERGFGASDTIRRLISDDIQIGYVDALVLIKTRAADPKLDLIMVANVLQESPFGVIYVKNRKVKSIDDLKTAKFGDSGGSNAQLYPNFLATALKTPESSLKYENVPFDAKLRIAALFRGDLDVVAAMIYDAPVLSMRAKEAGIEIGEFKFASYGFNPYNYGIVVKRSFAEKNPQVVKAAVKATLEGWAYACHDPADAAKILLEYQKDSPPETMLPQVKIALSRAVSPDTKAHGLGYMSPTHCLDTYHQAVVSSGLKPDAINPATVWTADYMPNPPIMADCKAATE